MEAGTAWLGVRHTANAMPPPHHLQWDPGTMAALPFERIVLFDTASEAVLVAYDARVDGHGDGTWQHQLTSSQAHACCLP